jgi:two-component system, NarL family, response regulator LiaR
MQEHNTKIKILLADDHPLIRWALKNILNTQPDFKIVGEAGDGVEALKLVSEQLPDVVIMDISMPNMNGLEATRQIKAKHPDIAVLVLTIHGESEHVFGILEAGAAGYLTKAVFGEEVINSVRAVISGETVLSTPIAELIIRNSRRLTEKPVHLQDGERLSCRELEILKLVAHGMSNRDIATGLNLSLNTVKGHLGDIFAKLRVSSRTEAIMIGVRAGILSIENLK